MREYFWKKIIRGMEREMKHDCSGFETSVRERSTAKFRLRRFRVAGEMFPSLSKRMQDVKK